MATSYSEHIELLDGDVVLYVLATSKKKVWNVRFTNPLSTKRQYVRKSTGHSNKALAIKRAIELYQEYQSRSLLGLTTGKLTITALHDRFRSSMSVVLANMASAACSQYWTPYFKDADVTTLNSNDITDYFKWRVHNARSQQTASPSGWVASSTSVSYDTLRSEAQALRWLFNQGYSQNIIPRVPTFPRKMEQWAGVHYLPRNNRRGRFTKDTYRIITDECRRIRHGITNPKWAPTLLHPSLPFHQEDNPWQSVSKRDGEEGRSTRPKDFCSQRERFPLATWWFASLLMSNTGVRASELTKLRHRDISCKRDPDGQVFTTIQIDERVSKVRTTREAISADFHQTYLRYQIYCQELEYFFNRPIQPNDWLFPQPTGPNAWDGRREKLHNLYRPIMKRLGVHTQKVETAMGHLVDVVYSAYSFRSFYITQRLKEGMNIYTLAKQCGVSIKTLMKSYDVNETWTLRKEITKHHRSRSSDTPSADDLALLADDIQEWRE